MMRLHIAPIFLALSLSSGLAADRLPDGGVAEAAGRGVVRAWYAQPTDRYAHGVLGDRIEGGSLVVVDQAGQQFELVLPQSQVFEDLTPRIADLDGDGRNEVITIRTDVAAGAAVAVYSITGGDLVERAATAPIGTTHRWLSIAAIADFRGDGSRQIAIVKTPHIGGILEILSLRGNRLVSLYPPQAGYSTHFIGSRHLTLATAADLDSDGKAELLLPNQDRHRVIALHFGKSITEGIFWDLPAPVTGPIRVTAGTVAVPIESGETVRLNSR